MHNYYSTSWMIRRIFLVLLMVLGSSAYCLEWNGGTGWGCNPGRYCNGVYSNFGTRCVTCPAGYYCPGGYDSNGNRKLACAAGKYSTATGAPSASTCKDCAAGKYYDGTGAPSASTCKKCPGGTSSDSLGATSIDACTRCPVNTVSAPGAYSTGLCTATCAAGLYANTTTQGCQGCPTGRYSTSTNAVGPDSCEDVPKGSYASHTVRVSSSTRTWAAIAANSDLSYYVAAVYENFLFCSKDGGQSWLRLDAAGEKTWQGVAMSEDGTQIVATAMYDNVYKSVDGGETWHAMFDGSDAGDKYWGGITVSGDLTRMIVADGNDGYLSKSEDSGETWTELTGAGKKRWSDVTANQDFTFFAAITNQLGVGVHTSLDGGITWTEPTYLSNGLWLTSIYASADFSKLLISSKEGTGGQVFLGLRDDSGGGTITNFTQVPSNKDWSSCVADATFRHFTCAAYDDFIYLSTDGAGEVWVANGYTTPVAYLSEGANNYSLCAAGRYGLGYPDNTCQDCRPGTYVSAEGASTCDLCPGGRYSNVAGASSNATCSGICPLNTFALPGSSKCTDCPVGRFAQSLGSSHCDACQAGKYRTTGATCLPCVTGKYSLAGSTVCTQCEEGSFANQTGTANCTLSPPGRYTPSAGLTESTACAVGKYYDTYGGSACKDCDEGTFAGVMGSALCDACTAGKIGASTGLSLCTNCDTGTYSPTAGSSACTNCEPGHHTGGEGKSNCEKCPLGKSQHVRGQFVCHTCEAGKYASVVGQTSCEICSKGTYSAEEAPSCTPCEEGKYNSANGSSTCAACASGKFGNEPTAATSCEPKCPPGRYISTSKRLSCTDCAPGYYSIHSDVTACDQCDEGKTNGGGATNCLWYIPSSSPTGRPSVAPSGSPTSTPSSQPSTEPTSLPSGQPTSVPSTMPSVQPTSTPTATPTTAVPSRQPTSQPTTLCAQGKWYDKKRFGCIACEIGKYGTESGAFTESACSLCAKGTYSDQAGSEACTACPAGTARAEKGGTAQRDCRECLSGHYAPAGSSVCELAPRGTFSVSGAGAATPCAKGRYADSTGMGACLPCPLSTYNSQEGQTSCVECPAGRLTQGEGAASFDECVSPETNFILASLTLVFIIPFAFDYLYKSRFARVAFLRRERVSKRLVQAASRVTLYLFRFSYKAEAERLYPKAHSVLRVTAFLILGAVLTFLLASLKFIATWWRIIFKSLVLLPGVGIPRNVFLASVTSILGQVATAVGMPFIYDILMSPFIAVIRFLSLFLTIDFTTVNITCQGATAPIKLFLNLCLFGVTIVLIKSDFQVLKTLTYNDMTNKFLDNIVTPGYRKWANLSQSPNPGGRYHVAKITSFRYLYILAASSMSMISSNLDIFQSVLQYIASLVALWDFFDVNYMRHASTPACDEIRGYPNIDTTFALLASLQVWVLLFPAMYEASNVLIPGVPKGVPTLFKERDNDVTDSKTKLVAWSKQSRTIWKYLSFLAPDLYWAEFSRRWIAFVKRHTPYDTNGNAPTVSEVEALAIDANKEAEVGAAAEGVHDGCDKNEGGKCEAIPCNVNSPQHATSLDSPLEGDGGGVSDLVTDLEANDVVPASSHQPAARAPLARKMTSQDRLESIHPSVQRHLVQTKLEAPPRPAFRVLVTNASGTRSGSGSSSGSSWGSSSEGESADQDWAAALFSCHRMVSGEYVWKRCLYTDHDDTAPPSATGSGRNFSLAKISRITGSLESLKSYYCGGANDEASTRAVQALITDLRDATPAQVLCLMTHHSTTSLSVEQSSALVDAIEYLGGTRDLFLQTFKCDLLSREEWMLRPYVLLASKKVTTTITPFERVFSGNSPGGDDDSLPSNFLLDGVFHTLPPVSTDATPATVEEAWEFHGHPVVATRGVFLFTKDSMVLSTLFSRHEKEDRLWHEHVRLGMPSYWKLCTLEYEELGLRWHVTTNLPLHNKCMIVLCILLGIGHAVTPSGKRAVYVVLWKYARFLAIAFGYWTDDVCELYQIHETVRASSMAAEHPVVKRENEKDKEGGGTGGGGSSGLTASLPLTELQRARRGEYSRVLYAVIAARATLFQLIPFLNILAIFAESTSSSPLLVRSKTLEDNLPELVVREAGAVALQMEVEHAEEVQRIRTTELHEEDHAVPEYGETYLGRNGKEYAVTPSMREAIEKVNDLSRQKLRQVKAEEYQYREWKAWVQTPIIILNESRIVQFFLGLLFVCIVLCVLFAPSSSQGNIVTASLMLFFPIFLISSLRAYVVMGGVLGITDEDLSATFPFIFPTRWQEAHPSRDKDMRQSICEKAEGGEEGEAMPGLDGIHFAAEDEGEVAVTANPMHKRE